MDLPSLTCGPALLDMVGCLGCSLPGPSLCDAVECCQPAQPGSRAAKPGHQTAELSPLAVPAGDGDGLLATCCRGSDGAVAAAGAGDAGQTWR
jgi:hypothetical protein